MLFSQNINLQWVTLKISKQQILQKSQYLEKIMSLVNKVK